MIEVKGADQLASLAKVLRETGAKDLQRELGKAINRAVKPVKDDIKASAKDTLPSSGGLAARAAKSPIRTRRRSSQNGQAGVRLVSGDRTLSMWHLNEGIVRHRRKGKRPEEWAVQKIDDGFWDEPTGKAAPNVRRELVKAMDVIAKKIDKR